MGKHSRDNDEDGHWPKPVPKEDRSDDGKHDTGMQDDDKQDDDEK